MCFCAMWLDLPDQGSGGGGGGYPINQDPRELFIANAEMEQHSIQNDITRHPGEVEDIAGFVLYRLENGVLEYLLLKKVRLNDWSPPKGHVETGEECFEGAEREVLEETHLSMGDYDALDQYPIYFEYKTRNRILKRVHLWAARYLNYDKPVRLSREHDEFQWLDYEAAVSVVKRQYKEALMAADLVVRTFESL